MEALYTELRVRALLLAGLFAEGGGSGIEVVQARLVVQAERGPGWLRLCTVGPGCEAAPTDSIAVVHLVRGDATAAAACQLAPLWRQGVAAAVFLATGRDAAHLGFVRDEGRLRGLDTLTLMAGDRMLAGLALNADLGRSRSSSKVPSAAPGGNGLRAG